MTPFYADPLVTLYLGDCLEVMPTLDAESVDAIVTDPPYGLGFMGKHWDHGVPNVDFWAAMLRVAKPGAYLLAFGGTRTVHRIATNIEDAGWIIRDQLSWIYASGFPKGRANLKPAHEPIVLARKPGPLRPLAIDECRIGFAFDEHVSDRDGENAADARYPDGPCAAKPRGRVSTSRKRAVVADTPAGMGKGQAMGGDGSPLGRWPSNVLLSDPELFDEPNPYVVGSGATTTVRGAVELGAGARPGLYEGHIGMKAEGEPYVGYGDSGGYSRFFLVPKADRQERERGMQALSTREERPPEPERGNQARSSRVNVHPTVKPIDLMRHLVRLVTPTDGVVLDPFLGSGTTALAASEEGFRCIGIEREPEYLEIAKGRLMATPMGLGLDVPAPTKAPPKTHPDLSKHQPKRRSASENYTGGWAGTDEDAA